MKDFLTDLAFKIVIQNSSKIAMDSGSQKVGTQHILLALVENPEANVKFERTGVTVESLSKVIAKEFPVEGNGAPKKTKIQFDDEAKELFKEALTHSLHITQKKRMNIDMLIYSIIADNKNNAHRCLELLDVDMAHLESVVLEALAENKGEDSVLKTETVAPEDYATHSPGVVRGRATSSKGTKTLEQFATNLSALARAGKLDPVVGRTKEIERSLQVLSRRGKNNPILVGEPGVGKTAIIEGLAQELLTSKIVPERLRNCDIWSLDIGSLVAGTKYRGDFEGRLKKLIEEVQGADIILFIDEIHSLNTAGGGEGSVNAANILKPVLARGHMRVIGATTFDEYRKYFEKDAAMSRRFQQVDVKEPTIDETILILTGLRKEYESHHNIVLTDSAIAAAAKLSARYITDRFLPDKAIDLIDEAGSRAKMNALVSPPEVQLLEDLLARTGEQKKEAIKNSNFDLAAEFATQEKELIESISNLVSAHSDKDGVIEVTAADIAQILTASTGIPVVVPGEENKRFISMEKVIGKRVIGQKSAISAISKSVRRQRSGLKDPNRPAGSFIFAGPTGVGKTELAKALAEFMFQDEDAVITLDMSEYSEKHTVSRLFGAPPGFVGHEEGGQLTEKVRRKPYSIVLFDEIEKAHPDVFNSLLQILEEGRLTDGQGRMVDFKNTVIIMTTNVGAQQMQTAVSGFQLESNKEANYVAMKGRVMGELKRNFKPEFLNRLDDIVVFPHLTKPELVQIVDIFVARLNKRLVEQNLSLTVSDEAKAHLVTIGYDEKLGARPLRRAVESTIADSVTEMILYGLLDDEENIHVDYVEKKMTFNGKTEEEISNSQEELFEV
jgi:ATP-dependent Clp protease ATP-binding subunit ClpC